MTEEVRFNYADSGLPANPRWEAAAALCNQWLLDNMSMFGPERIVSFMHNQPVAAAKRIFDNCQDWSEESITLLLLGPARHDLLGNPANEPFVRQLFGEKAIDLLQASLNPDGSSDDAVQRDLNRIFLAEAVSSMNDQMIGRARIDKHHQVRWNMLNHFERTHAAIKGQDPGLDALFEDAARQSKEALVALDKAEAAKKRFKPPGM